MFWFLFFDLERCDSRKDVVFLIVFGPYKVKLFKKYWGSINDKIIASILHAILSAISQ